MASIGIFDSGYGGLTIFKAISDLMPQYNFVYLGDNARAPYGNLTYDEVYKNTLECVTWLFNEGCSLVILACNTASAKALRSIQQNDLQKKFPGKRVLGVIRPTAEVIGNYSKSNHIGILGTSGTVQSGSYPLEIDHFYPELNVLQHACPLWVPLIEANDFNNLIAENIIKADVEKILEKDEKIDTILLACTHYPLIKHKIQQFVPESVTIVSQEALVAESLSLYLERHQEIEDDLGKRGERHFYTTGDSADFEAHTLLFFGHDIVANHCELQRNSES